jgi:hypothetical protein
MMRPCEFVPLVDRTDPDLNSDLRLKALGQSVMSSHVNIWKFCLALLGASLGAIILPAQNASDEVNKDALEVLQRKVVARERAAQTNEVSAPAAIGRLLTFSEIEQLFLEGKITARQFQSYIELARSQPRVGKSEKETVIQSKAIKALRQAKPDPSANPKPGPAIKPEQIPLLNEEEPESVPDPIEQGFSDIESKMDELLRWKAERDKQSRTNAPPPEGAASPKTKRQRLDNLLRLYIQNKITETEYKEKRAKIVAEPD